MNKNTLTLPNYNGYSSKFTWLVALWLDNDYGLYQFVSDWAQDCEDVHELAQKAQDFVTDNNPLSQQASMYSDLLGYALALVDFREVVQSHWDEQEDAND